MRVTFSSNLVDMQQAIATASADMATHQREMSTLRRLNALSDDPNGACAAISERTEMAATDQYQASADSVASRLTVMDSALSELVNQATAAQSAALSGRGSTLKPTQRETIAAQIEGIRDAIVSTMNIKFRGTYLFSGNEPTVAPYTKTGATISAYQGGSGSVYVDIDRQASVQVGVSGDAILKGSDPKDLIRVLDDLAAAVRTDNGPAMDQSTIDLEAAFSRLTTTQARVGNDMAQVDARKQQLTARHLSSQARVANLENVDLAKAVTDMSAADTAYQSALKAVGDATRYTLLDYLK